MADTKITSLQPPQAGYSVVPATDVLPIVVIADPGMATSGSTRKVTVNQLLGAGGTATLASATISGALTVDTTTLVVNPSGYADRVGIGTATPATTLDVVSTAARPVGISNNLSSVYVSWKDGTDFTGYVGSGANAFTGLARTDFGVNAVTSLILASADVERYRISSTGIATWSNVGGVAGTAMTLNSTGLGVGVSPTGYGILALKKDNTSAPPYIVLDNRGTGATDTNTYTQGGILFGAYRDVSNPAYIASITVERKSAASGASSTGDLIFGTASTPTTGVATERLRIDSSGNVGIGVSPAAGIKLDVNGNLAIRDTFNLTMGFANQQRILAGGTSDNTFLTFSQWTGAAYTERMRIKQAGQVRFVPLAADPSGAEAGDVYYNSSSNKLKCYNGTTWNDLF